MTGKTLFIGMDGATFTILDELTQPQGGQPAVMPHLGKIMAEGTRSKLRSTPNPLTPPAWVSLMTGKTPGNHGVFDFIRAEEQGGDVFFTLYDARDNLAETIWSIASREGKSFAALNFPFTAPPPRDLNGIVVPGFIPWRHLRRNTLPMDLYDRLRSDLVDFDPKSLAWDFEQEKQALAELTDEDRAHWIEYHLPREKQWFRIAEFILEEETPDLMAIMFDGVDKLQHQAWYYLDPALAPEKPDEYFLRMRKLCLDYFSQLDGFIGALVSKAGPDTQVFLASDHGFTATTEVVRINAYLHDLGYLHWKDMSDVDDEAAARREESMFANLDWAATTAYCRTPSSNGINIRVANKPGEGGVPPDEYEAFRDKLIEDLGKLTCETSGERIIREVHKREDVFPGPAMKDAPDLLLVLRDYGFVSIKNHKPVVMPRSEPAGTHHPDGVFMAYGTGVKQGHRLDLCNIEDVGATLLYSLGISVPEDFDGRVPEAMFEEGYLAANPVQIGAATSGPRAQEETEDMGAEDKQAIMDQLKMLGYME